MLKRCNAKIFCFICQYAYGHFEIGAIATFKALPKQRQQARLKENPDYP